LYFDITQCITKIYNKKIMNALLEKNMVSSGVEAHSLEDVIHSGLDRISRFYGVDMHELSQFGRK